MEGKECERNRVLWLELVIESLSAIVEPYAIPDNRGKV